jgi:hypothetical protein
MTDTTAPTTIRTLAETTVKIFSDHWGKTLSVLLTAVTAYAMGHLMPILENKPTPAPKVEIVRTVPVPSALELKVGEVVTELKLLREDVQGLKPKPKAKARVVRKKK